MQPPIELAFETRDQLGETPLWCARTRRLWWLDIERPTLHSLDPATAEHHAEAHASQFLGSLALRKAGGQVLALDLSLYLRAEQGGPLRHLTTVEAGLDNRLNDGRVDPRGRLWIGTMDNALHRPNGALYRVDPDGATTRIFGDVIVSNGIAFAPDGRRMYFSDTRRYQTWVMDLDPDDGVPVNRRLLADFTAGQERPDGTCVDADGCLWVAMFGGGKLLRLTPDGRIDREIRLPVSNPTCACFGGPDLKTLFVTTATKFLGDAALAAEPLAGSVLALHGLGQGLPENRFGG